jgi:putative Holliday junction resolvase
MRKVSNQENQKILGVDYGQSKVGLAISDTETKIAVPLTVVSFNDLNLKIEDLIKSEKVEKIVVGLPLGLNGQETEQTREVKEFIKDLRTKTKAEIVTEDERLSTALAKKQGKDDAVAAMYILQSYIDRIYG